MDSRLDPMSPDFDPVFYDLNFQLGKEGDSMSYEEYQELFDDEEDN